MKMRTAHVVMLSTQALAILREIRLLTGGGKLVFPSPRKDGKPISENTLRSALIRLGYTGEDQTTHGFRRTFSSMANEAGFRPDVIELCLAHQERNKVRSAYNAAQYFQERRQLMQWWGDECDRLRTDKSVIDFRKAAEGK
jgi:integrase